MVRRGGGVLVKSEKIKNNPNNYHGLSIERRKIF